MNELEKMEKGCGKELDKVFKDNNGWITPKIKPEMNYDMALKSVQDATEEETANRIVELYNCIEVNSLSHVMDFKSKRNCRRSWRRVYIFLCWIFMR